MWQCLPGWRGVAECDRTEGVAGCVSVGEGCGWFIREVAESYYAVCYKI